MECQDCEAGQVVPVDQEHSGGSESCHDEHADDDGELDSGGKSARHDLLRWLAYNKA